MLRTDRRTRGQEKNSPRKRQQGFSAANNALIKASCCEVRATWRKDLAIREFEDLNYDKGITTSQFNRRPTKRLAKTFPRSVKKQPWDVPRPSKIEAREAPGSQNLTKTRPRASKKGPRAAHYAPKTRFLTPTWRTCLQVGGPRPSQNEAET